MGALAIVVESGRDERRAIGAALSERLNVAIVDPSDLAKGRADASLLLVVAHDGIEIAAAARGRARPGQGWRGYRDKGVRVDLGGIDARVATGARSRKQPIARAVGRDAQRVVDATAGLGQDARLLAAIGYDVTAVERAPVVAVLLEDGLRRAGEDPEVAALLGDRMRLREGDVRDVVPTLDPAPDVVYVDPMFPPRRKESALARKPVRMLRAVVGEDPDAAEVVAELRAMVRRVVVKRPPEAPPLAADPTFTVTSKLARYDVYVDAGRPRGSGAPDALDAGSGGGRGERADGSAGLARTNRAERAERTEPTARTERAEQPARNEPADEAVRDAGAGAGAGP